MSDISSMHRNQQGSAGGSRPRTVWWVGLACAVVIVLVSFCLFLRQRTGQAVQVPATASPEEVAHTFLDALGSGDRDTANGMLQGPVLNEPKIWGKVNGLKLISLGEPAVNPRHRGGWFVPYVARLESGETLESQVSVRNDLPGGEWQVDGF